MQLQIFIPLHVQINFFVCIVSVISFTKLMIYKYKHLKISKVKSVAKGKLKWSLGLGQVRCGGLSSLILL